MAAQTKIILLTLGEELLLGLTANGHLTYIGDQLRQGGARLHANITLSDAPEDIAEHFLHYWQKADVLITTGGLGPTVDDRTKEIIADALGETLVFDAEIMAAIEKRFAERNLVLTDNNRKQAYRFKRAGVLENPNGSAPGLWLEKDGKILVMLPGPPSELQPMFENHVLPRFRELGFLADQSSYLQIRSAGIGESSLETRLQPVLAKYEGIDVAYCAHLGIVDFRLSFPSDSNPHDRLIAAANECKELLGADFICCGNDSLIATVSNILRRRAMSLAVAESCTGGMIANELTDLSGASDFFCGGITAYSNDAKAELLGVPEELIRQHTEVSMEVAIAMALGVSERLESDFAISTTGYLGPGGGTEANPLGTVYVGMHSPRGSWAKRFFFKGARVPMKRRILSAALDWLRRELLADAVGDDTSHDELKRESVKIIRSLR